MGKSLPGLFPSLRPPFPPPPFGQHSFAGTKLSFPSSSFSPFPDESLCFAGSGMREGRRGIQQEKNAAGAELTNFETASYPSSAEARTARPEGRKERAHFFNFLACPYLARPGDEPGWRNSQFAGPCRGPSVKHVSHSQKYFSRPPPPTDQPASQMRE